MTAPEVAELLRNGWRRRGNTWTHPGTFSEPVDLPDRVYPDTIGHQYKPCGTEAAQQRHRRRGETCRICKTGRAAK